MENDDLKYKVTHFAHDNKEQRSSIDIFQKATHLYPKMDILTNLINLGCIDYLHKVITYIGLLKLF